MSASAILGASAAAARYAKLLAGFGRPRCRYIHSRSAERARDFAVRFGIPQPTDDLGEVLRDPEVRTVIVCNEPERHIVAAEACLAAGKHVLIEKPLAADTTAAARLVVAARLSTCVVSVVSQYRFDPALRAMQARWRQRAASGARAVLRMEKGRDDAYFRKGNGWRLRSPAVLNQGIHGLDILLWFFGDPVRVEASSTVSRPSLDCPDTSQARLTFSGGVTADFFVSTAGTENRDMDFSITGADGRVDRRDAGSKIDLREAQLMDFLEAAEWGRPPGTTLADAFKALALARDILAAGRAKPEA